MSLESKQHIGFIITSTGWGGLEMNVLKLALKLREQGFEVTLISEETCPIYRKSNIHFQNILKIQKNKRKFDFKAAKELSKLLKANQISKIISFDNRDLDLISWCKKCYFPTLFVIYQQHMQIGVRKKSFIHTWRYKSINWWLTPLQFLKDEIALKTRFPMSKVKIVPLTLETNRFTEGGYSQENAREKLGIHSFLPIIGIMGRISEKKGQLYALKAAEILWEKGENFLLLIAGSATVDSPSCQEYEQKLHQYILEKKLESKVICIPHGLDVLAFYASIQCFVMASQSETVGMVTIEAMLSEIPVIGTNAGGTPELLQHGKFGKLFEYENQEQLASCILETLSKPEVAVETAKKAKEYAIKEFDILIEIEAFKSLLKN